MHNDGTGGRVTYSVIGSPIDALDESGALQRIASWAGKGKSRTVYRCNAHSLVTARRDPAFATIIRQADMALADGAPVAWMLRRQGVKGQRRVYGPDLMWAYCAHAAAHGEAIYLFGASPGTLQALQDKLRTAFPGLIIAGASSPPFRPLTAEEDAAIVAAINTSGASTLWVSLGCPKQEHWITAHRGHIQPVLLGVGGAFDFHAGTAKQAPAWMRNNGLEWLHRLWSEPRRLWKRYLVTNTLFIAYAIQTLWQQR